MNADDRRIAVSIFPNTSAQSVQERALLWSELVQRICSPKQEYERKAEMPLVKLARFGDVRTDKGSLRHDANVLAIDGIEGDYDAGGLSLPDAATLLADAGINAVLYTSPNHDFERPRWRVLCPLSHARSPEGHRLLVGRLNRILGGVLAPESFALSQSFYIGRARLRDDDTPAIYEAQEVRGHRDIDEADELKPLYPINGHAKESAASQARDDPVLNALRERGMLLRAIKTGTHAIRCPWEAEHTTDTGDTATAYLQANFDGRTVAGFKCMHGHCVGRSLGDLLAFLGVSDDDADAAERAMTNARATDALDHQCDEQNATARDPWPELQPLEVDRERAPYPIEALPAGIREAVEEVVAFVQCPPALAACSALSALSLAGQALADVRRAMHLSGPTSLYLLAIADSGERKTTCDNYYMEAVREWEREEAKRAEPDLAAYAAKRGAWEARRDGVGARIRQAAKDRKPTEQDERELATLERECPKAPRVPRVLYGDATPEALASKMALGWPSGGVMSSEAGIVFGSHGMKSDNVMRNLSLLNTLWEGGTVCVDRKQSESFTLTGARLTMGLAAQPDTVRAFMEATKGLPRGNGFAARFLIAHPETTQGTRLFKPADEWRCLPAFHARLRELLAMTPKPDDDGGLSLPMLDFDAAASETWIRFYDDAERELREGGELSDVRDVASKAADNVARLAALFHLFAHGATGGIGAASVTSAAAIVGWHLFEARRFLGDVAAPRERSNARRLDRVAARLLPARGCVAATAPHRPEHRA